MKRFNKIVGIGGIGVGMLFHSPTNKTFGRNESRLVELSGAKDYCKLHIVFHYISSLLSPDVDVCPIGFVGDDANGEIVKDEMSKAGMNLRFIQTDGELPTTVSVCLQYPDKDGFNFTSANGANKKLSAEYISHCLEQIEVDSSTIAAAIPEVDVDNRIYLMKSARKKGAFCVLSVPVSEAEEFKEKGAFAYCDLLAVNEDEAKAIVGSLSSCQQVSSELYDYLKVYNPDIMLLVTCGKHGAYSVHNGHIEYIPVMPIQAVNATGAGDAFLGGTIAAISMGISFQKGTNDTVFGQTPVASAAELGAICAGMAVECEDSIVENISKQSVCKRMKQDGWKSKIWFRNEP
jgi:sugar/nucleoside kinase (ribokinase family)